MTEPTPERRVIYRGRKIDLALQGVRLADGTIQEREVVLHRGAVALVPMVDDDHVCLVENHRYSVGKTLVEVPAGTIDPGESPDATAARELAEETGYHAGRIERVAEWYVSPGVFNERMFVYYCMDLTPGATDLQPDERLTPVVVPWSEALRMARRPHRGRQDDAGAVALRPAPRSLKGCLYEHCRFPRIRRPPGRDV